MLLPSSLAWSRRVCTSSLARHALSLLLCLNRLPMKSGTPSANASRLYMSQGSGAGSCSSSGTSHHSSFAECLSKKGIRRLLMSDFDNSLHEQHIHHF